MHNKTSGAHIGLGRYMGGGPDWTINSVDPLNFTVTYHHGDVISEKSLYVLFIVVVLLLVYCGLDQTMTLFD